MRYARTFIATALSVTLAAGALVGCGGQQESVQNEATQAPEAASQSQEELIAEFKEALAGVPAYKSVTLEVEETSVYPGEDSSDDETFTAKTLYKFDASGSKLRTSAEVSIDKLKLVYYTDGTDAVFVSDGPVYSGTTEQFDLGFADGVEDYLDDAIGDLDDLVAYVDTVEKVEKDGLRLYTLALDADAYAASDDNLQLLKDSGTTLAEAQVSVGFGSDGRIASLGKNLSFEDFSRMTDILFSDYDNTAVEAMPKADKTFEQMEADSQAKLDALAAQIDADEAEDADDD